MSSSVVWQTGTNMLGVTCYHHLLFCRWSQHDTLKVWVEGAGSIVIFYMASFPRTLWSQCDTGGEKKHIHTHRSWHRGTHNGKGCFRGQSTKMTVRTKSKYSYSFHIYVHKAIQCTVKLKCAILPHVSVYWNRKICTEFDIYQLMHFSIQ